MREERIKKKKRKLNIKNFVKILLILVVITLIIVYLLTLRVTNIKIIGTTNISDLEVIEAAKLKDYPHLFSVPSLTLKRRIKTLDLVNNVKIHKNLYGRITIDIDEAKILFYNKTNNKVVLSNYKEVDYKDSYLGLASLINYVPSDIYNELIKGLSVIDKDILSIISEIEYAPSKTSTGEVIDNYRFLLRMNDSNTVYMNTINIKKLNKYLEITSTILDTNEEKNGILYLDSSIEDSFSFKSYESIKREEEKKIEEQKKLEEEMKKNESTNQN